jgi:hypothetical protein
LYIQHVPLLTHIFSQFSILPSESHTSKTHPDGTPPSPNVRVPYWTTYTMSMPQSWTAHCPCHRLPMLQVAPLLPISLRPFVLHRRISRRAAPGTWKVFSSVYPCTDEDVLHWYKVRFLCLFHSCHFRLTLFRHTSPSSQSSHASLGIFYGFLELVFALSSCSQAARAPSRTCAPR